MGVVARFTKTSFFYGGNMDITYEYDEMNKHWPDLNTYNVYEYTFIDDVETCFKPILLLPHNDEAYMFRCIYKLTEMFSSKGWEGDGYIGFMYLPPFFGPENEYNYSFPIFHVKQRNNGISFIACPNDMQLPRSLML